ncbi:ImmA/IrrE family metallo-endopeptidase [Qiania dongpingensis]|uniref:ImmA/IrrE family metallo-endopeptidase n=1 Tax=Qiania dongpingensis TaxID=2763669 RepID=A0A7G9G5G9_9FIRM|nr:ImmA/IrrE family metallo-endopeptidase [Qiania dongpingensis]QNM06051.1 ImmA/IrrE family metallo-endopeptidase [Qiania dongpingensis]
MEYDLIEQKILETYRTLNICSFPIDCFEVLKKYGFRICSYQDMGRKNPELYQMALRYSEDAFRFKKRIFYNQDVPDRRIRFSLAHEFAHCVLNHRGENPKQELEANCFAGRFLAPAMAIHYTHCRNARDVSNVFDISLEAAGYAYRNYQSWIRTAARRMSAYDKAMYEHFYDTKKKKFICRRSSSFPWGEEFSLENHMVLGEDV